MKRILLLIDYSSEFSRRILKGLIQYSKDHGPWIFYRLPSYYKTLYGKEGIIQWAKEWKADAILARWDHEGTNLLESLRIPIVLQNYKERSPYFSNLTVIISAPVRWQPNSLSNGDTEISPSTVTRMSYGLVSGQKGFVNRWKRWEGPTLTLKVKTSMVNNGTPDMRSWMNGFFLCLNRWDCLPVMTVSHYR